MPTFTRDNTTGYTESQLEEINRRYAIAICDLDPDSPTYKSECDHAAEQVLSAYDAE